MYRIHPMLRMLSDETKLWRYMDLSEFLWLISEKCLYFANPQELSDKWEGAWPASIVTEVEKSPEFIRLLQEGVNAKYASQVVASLRNNRQGGYAVNCWHRNDVESIAMWKLYTSGDDGVAIQTTVGRMKASLVQEARDLFIVEVEYSDHDGQDPIGSSDALLPLARKRRSFSHESEVRVILDRGLTVDFELAAFVSGTPFGGETIALKTGTLIERIVTSPTYPPWTLGSLRSQIQQKGITVKVETSDLLKLPDPDRMYRNLRMSAAEEVE
jgi:hypothetical protein